MGNSKLVITRWRQPLAGRQQSRFLLFDFATLSSLFLSLFLSSSLIFSASPVAFLLPLILSCHSTPLDLFLFLSPSNSSSRGSRLACSYTTCGMIVCDAERSGIRGLSLWWPTQRAAAGTRAATEIRAELSTTIVPFNSDTHVRCTPPIPPFLLHLLLRETAAVHGSVVLGDACGMQPLLLSTSFSLALGRHDAYASSGKRTGKELDDVDLTDHTCKYQVFHHRTLRITRNAAWVFESTRAELEKNRSITSMRRELHSTSGQIYSSFARIIPRRWS